ncbi:hypothetical protein [Xanthocytophaga flava]|uniref:hypothetical protein n=1 Tax=Xanthocytophaga flava TaxID=3048013 RepID=UPI0028D125C7|nr:hypothetical protein [Xanthocytophaga flavus]MDJ1472829.1 hypothetical protein [Xanthocytophaga flavus]
MSYIKDKLLPYGWPTFFLLIGVGGIYLYWTYSSEPALPVVLSIAGLTFGVFQTLLNIKIQSIRNLYALRQTEYKNVLKLLNDISDETTKKIITSGDHATFASLIMNKGNELSLWIELNDNHLFPALKQNMKAKELYEVVKAIVVASHNTFVKNEELKQDKNQDKTVDQFVLDYNFELAVQDFIKAYKSAKLKFLIELQYYFK